jgi:hypothetical protein
VTYIDRTPDKPVEDIPPLPDLTRDEWKDLLRREALFNEQQDKASHAARECLQQLLYVGRVPSKIIPDQGVLIETPKHVWGGDQWSEAFRSNRIWFAPRLGVTVSGRPLIPRDALEAAFNSDGVVKEKPEQKRNRGRRARGQESALLAFAALYPAGLPNDPWKTITAKVNTWLIKNGKFAISDDTVRRAAESAK